MKRFKQGSKGIEIRRRNLLDQTVSAFRLKQSAYKFCREHQLTITEKQPDKMVAHDLNWSYIITPYNGGEDHE